MATKKTETEAKSAKKTISDTEIERIARNTGKRIAMEEKVLIMIAPDEKEPMWRGCINGYDYAFPKGQLIEVPKSVAKLIENSTRMSYAKTKMENAIEKGLSL